MKRSRFINNGQGAVIRDYLLNKGYILKDVAAAVGISPSDLSMLLSGKIAIGPARARKLCDKFGFSYDYLLRGEGSLFPDNSISQTTIVESNDGTVAPTIYNNSNREAELVMRIEELQNQIKKKEEEISWLRGLVDRSIGKN